MAFPSVPCVDLCAVLELYLVRRKVLKYNMSKKKVAYSHHFWRNNVSPWVDE